MIDILQRQRVETEDRNRQRDLEENGGEEAGGLEGEARQRQAFPSALSRRYELRVIPRTGSVESFSLRHIRSDSIGKLVSVKGMITRASDVKPHCEVCAYSCDRCGFEIFQQTAGKSFTPIRKCPTEACSAQAASMEETVYPQTRGSKFTKYQEIKLQEVRRGEQRGESQKGLLFVGGNNILWREDVSRDANRRTLRSSLLASTPPPSPQIPRISISPVIQLPFTIRFAHRSFPTRSR